MEVMVLGMLLIVDSKLRLFGRLWRQHDANKYDGNHQEMPKEAD